MGRLGSILGNEAGRDGSAFSEKVIEELGELFPRVGFIVTHLRYPVKGIVNFFNSRGTAEQWIKEGRYALDWTRLSCHKFVVNQVRLLLFILAYNLGNFFKMLALPEAMKRWSLKCSDEAHEDKQTAGASCQEACVPARRDNGDHEDVW